MTRTTERKWHPSPHLSSESQQQRPGTKEDASDTRKSKNDSENLKHPERQKDQKEDMSENNPHAISGEPPLTTSTATAPGIAQEDKAVAMILLSFKDMKNVRKANAGDGDPSDPPLKRESWRRVQMDIEKPKASHDHYPVGKEFKALPRKGNIAFTYMWLMWKGENRVLTVKST
jgi:hypothetical protein